MILDAIREQVGDKLLIEYRISGDEYAGPDGFGIEECLEFLKLAQDHIDIAHVSAGGFATETDDLMAPSAFEETGRNTYLAEAVKADPDIHIPVLTIGGYQRPEDIDRVIAEGKADLVAMARGTIADPDVPRKAAEGRVDEVIPCIRCFHCLDYGRCRTLTCSVNATVGREAGLPRLVEPAERSKRVVVVGGGPAGMQAAITAAERGHKVTLLERGERLGGVLALFEHEGFKKSLVEFRDYLIHMVEKRGVNVHVGTEATPDLVAQLEPDALIVAVGAASKKVPYPVAEGANVLTATEAYEHPERLRGGVVVAGGGETGCETALHLAANKHLDVALVGRNRELAASSSSIARSALLKHLVEAVPGIYPGTACKEITTEGVACVRGGDRFTIPADTVVMASGVAPRAEVAEAFRGIAPEFRRVGDCDRAGNVRTAVRQGYDAASCL